MCGIAGWIAAAASAPADDAIEPMLDALGFRAEEWEELQVEHRRLANAAGLIESVQFGLDTLSEGEASVQAALSSVLSRLQGMADIDPGLKETLDVLEPAQIQLQEAVYNLRHYQQRLDLDPQRLRDVEARLDAVHTASRKFKVQIPDIPERLAKMKARLAELAEGFLAVHVRHGQVEQDEPVAIRMRAVFLHALEPVAGGLRAEAEGGEHARGDRAQATS